MAEAIQAKADTRFPPAKKPTIYFVGMTTGKSSIMRVFPRWAEYLKLGDVLIQGIDCKWHDDPAVYRNVVQFIKQDPLSKGALVTTHKLDLLKACRDLFEFLDPYAQLMGEVSSISKRNGQLRGHAKDPISSGLALEAFLPKGHWEKTGAEAFSIELSAPPPELPDCAPTATAGMISAAMTTSATAPRRNEVLIQTPIWNHQNPLVEMLRTCWSSSRGRCDQSPPVR